MAYQVSKPTRLLPQERHKAIFNLQALGVHIDSTATVGMIARHAARVLLMDHPNTVEARVKTVRSFLRGALTVSMPLRPYEFKEWKPGADWLRAVERARNPHERHPGDGR